MFSSGNAAVADKLYVNKRASFEIDRYSDKSRVLSACLINEKIRGGVIIKNACHFVLNVHLSTRDLCVQCDPSALVKSLAKLFTFA